MHFHVHISSQIHICLFSFVPAEILVVYRQMGNGHFIKYSFLLIVYNNFLFDVVKYVLLKEVHLTIEEAAHFTEYSRSLPTTLYRSCVRDRHAIASKHNP